LSLEVLFPPVIDSSSKLNLRGTEALDRVEKRIDVDRFGRLRGHDPRKKVCVQLRLVRSRERVGIERLRSAELLEPLKPLSVELPLLLQPGDALAQLLDQFLGLPVHVAAEQRG